VWFQWRFRLALGERFLGDFVGLRTGDPAMRRMSHTTIPWQWRGALNKVQMTAERSRV
jgi:hypothetical protein